MAAKGLDFKELGMKYGERIGLGIGLLFMAFLVFRSFMLDTSNVKPEKIRKDEMNASTRVEQHPVKQEELIPPGTITPEAIVQLMGTVQKSIQGGAHSFQFANIITFPEQETFRNKPKVLAPTQIAGVPHHFAFRVRDIRNVNGKEMVLIAVPADKSKAIEFKEPDKEKDPLGWKAWNERRKREEEQKRRFQSGGGAFGPGGGFGAGGGMGPGGGPGGGVGPGGGLPPGGGVGPGGGVPPGGFPGLPGGAGGAGGDTNWSGQWIPADQLKPEHTLGENIYPARGALIYGSFPHKAQMEEIARQIKKDVSELPLYYKAIEIQRRELVLKGTRLPDGTIVQQDMVKLPQDRTLQPLSQVPENPVTDEEVAAAGWYDLNPRVLGMIVGLSVDLEEEQDSVRKSLMGLSTGLVMKLPKPLRGAYPDVIPKLPELENTLKIIVDEYKGKVPTPPRDPRLGNQDSFDPFGNNDTSGDTKAGGDKSGSGQGSQSSTSEALFPGNTMLRFLDLQFEGIPPTGRTFEYRVRVVISNPNFGEVNVSVPEYAKDPELRGPWSPSTRVTFPEETYFYADERLRDASDPNKNDRINADRVPVQLIKWLGMVPRLGQNQAEERVGEWWVDRVMAYRGEYVGVGRVANEPPVKLAPGQVAKPVDGVKLVVWVATTPDPETRRMGMETIQPVRTDALYTKTMLVDFDGGKWTRQNYKRGFDEDAPAEMLLVDATTGKLSARTQLKDKADPQRVSYFDKWKPWYEGVLRRYEEKSKTNTNAPGDRFGVGGGDRK